MTTQNTTNTLTNRIILSAAYDHTSSSPTTFHRPASSTSLTTHMSDPHHWQDQVPDDIMTRTPADITEATTPGNEFELDVESLTHTWQTVSTVAPLPGMSGFGDASDPHNSAQIRALNIDLGMMREIISVQGILYDSNNHPSSTSNHHIRRQNLLDIARTQWAIVHNFNRATSFEWNNINKYPALTIGPMHGRSTSGSNRDLGYYGDEPSNDIRGSFIDHVSAFNEASAEEEGEHFGIQSNNAWDHTFNYKGRRRYRGVIRRLTLTAIAGQPNIWRFKFDFEVIKNELELRMMSEDDFDRSIL